MLINEDRCTGCGLCIPYCPVGAIAIKEKKARVLFDECVECSNCLRNTSCPKDAIYQQDLAWPRTVRSIFSNTLTITKEAGISGRGTEEMKTNDVTGRIKRGYIGVGIEVGRPVIGARFEDIQTIAMAVTALRVQFETQNPLTSLMSDKATGKFPTEILNEKVLSAIIEFTVSLDRMSELIQVLQEVSKRINTVFSLCIASRVNEDGSFATTEPLKNSGLWPAPNGKANVGLGRPLFEEA